MPRQNISLTEPRSAWLKRKVECEYCSNSEAVNDLIRRAREIEAIRAHLIEAERNSTYYRIDGDQDFIAAILGQQDIDRLLLRMSCCRSPRGSAINE